MVLLFLGLTTPAWAYIETPTGVDVQVSYTEPTTTEGGAPLTNLQKTTIYWKLDAGAESAVDVLAALGTGGAAITKTISVPLAACTAGTVSVQATASNTFGESVRTPAVTLAVARVQGCKPSTATNLLVK
mgnify:CR=1 FL=1